MKRSKRALWLAFFFLLPLLLPAACGHQATTPPPAVPLRVAYDRGNLSDAPVLIAQSQGYFRQGGLDVVLVPGGWKALAAGQARVGTASPDRLSPGWPAFTALDRGSGSFLLLRSAQGPFTWSSLAGKTILTGPDGSFPTLLLRFILKQHRLATAKVLAGTGPNAFRRGTGDAIILNEPAATAWTRQKTAHPAASLAAEGGPLLAKAVAAPASFLSANHPAAQAFTDALFRAELWLYDHNPEQIAHVLAPYFPGQPPGALDQAVRRYWIEGVWAAQPAPSPLVVSRTSQVLGHPLDADLTLNFAEKALRTVF